MGRRVSGVNLCLKVKRRCGGAERYRSHIFLNMSLQSVDKFGRLAGAYEHYPGSERVKSAGMADLKFLDFQASQQRASQALHRVKRSPAMRLVDI